MGRQAGSAIRLRIEAPSPHELRCLVPIERLFQNLALSVEPFATCRVAPGWRLQLPIRDWVTFHFILQGEGGLRVGSGEVLPLRPDCLGIMPPRLTHSIESGSDVQHESSVRGDEPGAPICRLGAGPSEDVGVVVACGRIQVTYGGGGPGLFDRLEEAIVLDFSDSPPMRTTFESLVAEFGTGEPGSSAMMTALMNQCLISVFRRLSDQSDQLPWLDALEDPNLARVLDAILEKPERPHSLESLAELANMSRSVSARRFHECFDRTPMDYLRDVRLRRAARLLQRAELSVNDVASKVGFASRSHFSHAFRDHFGCAPAEFREAPG